MKLIMFAGSGAVGKTALAHACVGMAEEHGIRVVAGYSSTRETYARYGLKRESDALKDPDFNMKFQHDVMGDNIIATERVVANAISNNAEMVLVDRTPYDYASYFFTVFQDHLDLSTIGNKRDTCDAAMLRLVEMVDQIQIVFLPYPGWWSKDTESSDGWRADKTGKNFVWSAVVESELQNARARLTTKLLDRGLAPAKIVIDRLPSFAEQGNVQARAASVLISAFPHHQRRTK